MRSIKTTFAQLLLTLSLGLGVATPAHAQFAGGTTPTATSPISATGGREVLGNINRDALFARQTTANTTRPEKNLPLALAGFKSGPSTFPETLAATLTDMNAAQQRQAAETFRELLRIYNEEIAIQDERLKNNVTGALVYSTYVSYYILTGIEMTEPQQEALFTSLNDALASEPQFKASDDAARQEMYEALVLTASLALGALQNGMEDPAQLEMAATLADGLFQMIYQRDASEVKFTDQGVETVSGAMM